MTQITIDAHTRETLRGVRESVRLVDESGRVVGTFKPVDVPPYDPDLIPTTSIEELHRRAAAGGGRPLDEILKDLQGQS